jgi:hypothetical protein
VVDELVWEPQPATAAAAMTEARQRGVMCPHYETDGGWSQASLIITARTVPAVLLIDVRQRSA